MSGVTIKFHGAAGTVTGSCFEFKGAGKRILVDCGMFQGTRSLEALNHEQLPFDPKKIDAVLLTHAHLDHSGRLAYLYASGCKAKTYCTAPSADIIKPLLQDSAKLQAADVERRNRRTDRAGLAPFTPLYDGKDIAKLHKNVRTVAYCEEKHLDNGVSFRFWDARHIVGSASIEINIAGQRLLFSGDVGSGRSINCAASEIGGYDHVICESTYGDRDRELILVSERRETLARHVEEVIAAGGNVLIPAFALERTQAILEDFDALFESRRLAPVNVFLDSPLAQKVTMAVMRYRDSGTDMLKRTNIRFIQNTAESKKLNRMTGIVIIAGSGMCTGGRIRHHLVRNLPNRHSRLLLSGFQVTGTLGPVLRDGARRVRISGHDVMVKAQVAMLDGYSNHADRSGLVDWIRDRTPISGSLFLVHGEQRALAGLAETLGAISNLPATIIPALGETWELHKAKLATRLSAGRPEAADLTASRDWISKLAALRQEVEEKLSEQPTNQDREKMLAALKRALESV
ncbi:MBL fold metallo-hydrolase [Parasphingorhabdus sp.]|uniref:MBL fold metallo-hydrolase n=1 Tax=Parasphingorhabdus sp. TaxID=2709688 RepID=UPI0030AD577A|nr:MBL fold metallo-hydrolase [Sphingomonadales bacterium]